MEVMPVGQLCDLEAVVPDRLAETIVEGGLFFSLVAGAQAVPVQLKVLGPVGETAGEGSICSLGHCEPGWGEGEGPPGTAGDL